MDEIIAGLWVSFVTATACICLLYTKYFRTFEDEIKKELSKNGNTYISSRRKSYSEKIPFSQHHMTMWNWDYNIYVYRYVKYKDKDNNHFESCAELRVAFLFKLNQILWKPLLSDL